MQAVVGVVRANAGDSEGNATIAIDPEAEGRRRDRGFRRRELPHSEWQGCSDQEGP